MNTPANTQGGNINAPATPVGGPSPLPPGPSPEAQVAYDARWKRIMDCVALKQPDRMPVTLYCFNWLAKYGGVSHRELMYDMEKAARIAEQAILEFQPDGTCPFVTQVAWGPSAEAVGLKNYRWAGHGVGDDQSYQYIDKEYVTVKDYDDFLDDPTAFHMKTFLPRIATSFEGLANMPSLPTLSGFRALSVIAGFARPEVKESLQKIVAAAEEVVRLGKRGEQFNHRIKALGYPMIYGATTLCAYDLVADFWRGATGMMKDIFRHKDKMLEVLDRVTGFQETRAVTDGKASGNPIVFLPIHWAPDAFMSQEQFETLWWPSCRRLMMTLIDHDLIPMVLWEHDCTKRLEAIADIPAGECIYFFERADNLIRAHEIMGNQVALRGGLSASLMTTGTPDAIDAEVRKLVEKVWNRGGKLILDCGIGIPDEAPVDNVRAMFAAARKYAG